MIKVENIDVWGFEHAIRGMRNPMNSWSRSDSEFGIDCHYEPYNDIGENDLNLMQRLTKAGSEHRKFARQLFISMDVVCHHVWWSEFDTYKVGTVKDSCSKMHTIHVNGFEPDDFSHEGIDAVGGGTKIMFDGLIMELEWLRRQFNATKEKKYWRAIIELLPMGYNIRATVTMNYENAMNMIHQREHHKLDEWCEFVEVLRGLPYMAEMLEGVKK